MLFPTSIPLLQNKTPITAILMNRTILLGFAFFFTLTNFLFPQKFKGLANTPPMGWNSWNCFECDGISEQTIKEIADAMVRTGMKDAGYRYIVIDDCWQIARSEDGTIMADPIKFPSGIEALADYIHSKGLKFGIYSCAGTQTCENRPGSRGHEYQDARTYAEWGVDYLKYDWCNTGSQDAIASYTTMRDALYKAGRPIVFSMCEWGLSKPWLWAEDVAHLWRTTGDIRNNWDKTDAKEGKVWGGGVLVNFDMQHLLEEFSGPDHWNDPDMLEIGNGVLTLEECKTQMSLWAMLSAPLMAGNDLRTMDEITAMILTNEEVIKIDQDPLGKSAKKLLDENDLQVFVKPMAANSLSICFLNRSDTKQALEFDWNQINEEQIYEIRDLWQHKDIGKTDQIFRGSIAAHGVIHLLLKNAVRILGASPRGI